MATIQIRVDDKLKNDADYIFNALGMNTSEAVKIFLAKVIQTRGLPFELSMGNEGINDEEKREILQRQLESLENKNTSESYHSFKELHSFLNADEA